MHTVPFFTFQKEEVFRLALKSDDELFHVSLYDWMFSMNLTEKLLTVGCLIPRLLSVCFIYFPDYLLSRSGCSHS